jgi:proline iminopeptidase
MMRSKLPTATIDVPGLFLCLILACTPALACRSTTTPHEGYLAGSGGVRIFYRVEGNGPDTIVAIHGGPGGDMENIGPDLGQLASRHVVIYYDQRGGGRSELPADTTRLDARYFVEDLEAVRRHFGLERMNLLAHSFGPVLAARYAQVHPDRLERMIFMGAIGPRRADAAAFGRTMYARMDSTTRDSVIALVTALVTGMAPDPVATCRAYEDLLRRVDSAQGGSAVPKGGVCRAGPEAVEYANRYTSQITLASFGKWDYTGTLSRVSAPLLVIYGDRDPSPISSQRAWADAVPHGRLLVIPGAGHGPHVDRPDLFFPAVDTFLSGRWPDNY